MRKSFRQIGWLALLPALGCGAAPELLWEEVQSSAKEAVEEQIDELVDSAFDQWLDAAMPPSEEGAEIDE